MTMKTQEGGEDDGSGGRRRRRTGEERRARRNTKERRVARVWEGEGLGAYIYVVAVYLGHRIF
jgi:hypothetical protein